MVWEVNTYCACVPNVFYPSSGLILLVIQCIVSPSTAPRPSSCACHFQRDELYNGEAAAQAFLVLSASCVYARAYASLSRNRKGTTPSSYELLKMGTRQSRLRRKDGKPPSELLGWRKRRSDDKPSSEKEKAEVEGAAHAVTKGATPSPGKRVT